MAAAEEWGKPLQLRIASLDLKQAPKLPWVASTGTSVHPTLAEALREELRPDSAEMVFRNIRVESVGVDKSIKQGGRESPLLFNLVINTLDVTSGGQHGGVKEAMS